MHHSAVSGCGLCRAAYHKKKERCLQSFQEAPQHWAWYSRANDWTRGCCLPNLSWNGGTLTVNTFTSYGHVLVSRSSCQVFSSSAKYHDTSCHWTYTVVSSIVTGPYRSHCKLFICCHWVSLILTCTQHTINRWLCLPMHLHAPLASSW